jgi:hypothetical protein
MLRVGWMFGFSRSNRVHISQFSFYVIDQVRVFDFEFFQRTGLVRSLETHRRVVMMLGRGFEWGINRAEGPGL